MDDQELEEKIRTMGFSSGKNTITLDDMATIQPGLARIMPEIGARTWKLYYAAKALNWPMAPSPATRTRVFGQTPEVTTPW